MTKYTSLISPKTVDKGMFSKKYTAFTVKTSPFGYEVERRFNDFYWLRTCLVNEYPGLYVGSNSWRLLLSMRRVSKVTSLILSFSRQGSTIFKNS